MTVDLSANRGVPDHYGSGVLLGIPDATWPGMTQDQIPSRFYEEISLRYSRGGGSQQPAGAWITGLDGYYVRLNSTKSDYDKVRSYGAPYILLPHDLWGTDQVDETALWPGDNGDWTAWYDFLEQLTSDLVANDMLDGLIYDIWNEPDIEIFWRRSIEQWVDLYVRTHEFIRSKPELNGVGISGPSTSSPPTTDNPYWIQWLDAVSTNGIVPEEYSYHLLYGGVNVDLAIANTTLTGLLQQYNLPARQVNANEYAQPEEQVPSTSAWFLSRFERYDTFGLRANWASACQLHDFLANLVTKTGAPNSECGGTGYAPNGQYHVYAYYGTSMTGIRASTFASGDGIADAFATIGDDKVRILAGHRQVIGQRETTGTWQLVINNLSSVGLPENGEVTVQTWAFNDQGLYGAVDGPEDRGFFTHPITNNQVTFEIRVTQQDIATAFAFEFNVGGA